MPLCQDQEKKEQLQTVITYLHDQIKILRKSRKITHLIEQAYKETHAYRTGTPQELPQKEETTQDTHEQLNRLREHLTNKDYIDLKQTFTDLGRHLKAPNKHKNVVGEDWNRKDILDDIEIVHKKLEHAPTTQEDTETFRTLQKEIDDLHTLLTKKKKKKKKSFK